MLYVSDVDTLSHFKAATANVEGRLNLLAEEYLISGPSPITLQSGTREQFCQLLEKTGILTQHIRSYTMKKMVPMTLTNFLLTTMMD